MARYKVLETNGLNFKDLCQIGDAYKGEVGTSGVRQGALSGLQKSLEKAMNSAKGFQVANRSPQSTDAKGVKDLAAFHTSQQSHIKDAEQARLNQAAIRFRTWLSRQGAWFSGDSGINWDVTMQATVVYDSQLAQQNATKISMIGGRLCTPDGNLLDTARMVTHFSGPGFAIYVMSAEGNLHVSSHSVGHRHHSSLLGGGPVAGAGEIKVCEGRISFLSNKSGHYRPERRHLLNVLGMLQQNGVCLDFELLVQPSGDRYSTVDEFMKKNHLDDASIDQTVEDVNYIYSQVDTPSNYYKNAPASGGGTPSGGAVYANYTPGSATPSGGYVEVLQAVYIT